MAKDTQPVELMGRNAQQKILANAVQIRDLNVHNFPGNYNGYQLATLFDVSNYGDKGILVYNSHDQAISVNICFDVKQTPGNTATRVIAVTNDSLAAGTSKWYGVNTVPQLGDVLPYVTVQVQCSVAPTTGSISIYLEGAAR